MIFGSVIELVSSVVPGPGSTLSKYLLNEYRRMKENRLVPALDSVQVPRNMVGQGGMREGKGGMCWYPGSLLCRFPSTA